MHTMTVRAAVLEATLVTLLAVVGGAWLVHQNGFWSLSWDALNHHIYLGSIAETPRSHLDSVAASSQSYQYPYLYWPIYRLSLIDGSGVIVGMVWAALQTLLIVPPLWLFVYRLLPDDGNAWTQRVYRLIACYLALVSIPVLAAVGTTANDLVASVPVLWAVALGIGFAQSRKAILAAAALLGVGIAFKYSNVLYTPLALIWWFAPARPRFTFVGGFAIALSVALGFVAAYAPWGWRLWGMTGNPFYPHLQSLFSG